MLNQIKNRWSLEVMFEILDTAIKIGRQMHSIDAWDTFADSEIAAMDGNALTFWREHKPLIMSAARLHAAKVVKQEAA